MSQLHIWAVIRLLPNFQRVVVNRFRRRGDAENYTHLLRRYTPDGNFIIVFDPLSGSNPSNSQEVGNVDMAAMLMSETQPLEREYLIEKQQD